MRERTTTPAKRQNRDEFVAHYHAERNHQGLGNELIERLGRSNVEGPVRRRQRLGGMLNYNQRVAEPLDAAEFSDIGASSEGWHVQWESVPPE